MPESNADQVVEGELSAMSLNIPFPDTFVYSNASAFSASMMDFRISFAEALPSGNVVARVGVSMTPEHTAHVALNLLKQLSYFERYFGPIRNQEWRDFSEAAGLGLTKARKAADLTE